MIWVKNISGENKTWQGHLLGDNEFYEIGNEKRDAWANNTDVIDSVLTGDLLVATHGSDCGIIADEITAADFLVNGDTNFDDSGTDLETAVKAKNKAIDLRTRTLIAQGFVYDSVVFSTSETAQRNWIALNSLRDDLTYPFNISTKADGEYSVANAVDLHDFVLTGMGTVEYHYGTGRALKISVNSAATVEDVCAILDAR